MNAVAFDWITRNLYWTDGLYKIVGVASTNVGAWKVIVDRNLNSPQDIAIDPVQQ